MPAVGEQADILELGRAPVLLSMQKSRFLATVRPR